MDITPGSESLPQNHAHLHTSKDLLEHFHFPKLRHNPPAVIDVNKVADERLSVGQKIADAVASTVGSWRFIIIQSIILCIWLVLNSVAWIRGWDPYPFILLNLALSFQAAYSAPFVMMSQNRQSEKDRLTALNDYNTDCKSEQAIYHIMEHLDHQDELILQIVKRLEDQHKEMMGHLVQLDPELAETLAAKMSQETTGHTQA